LPSPHDTHADIEVLPSGEIIPDGQLAHTVASDVVPDDAPATAYFPEGQVYDPAQDD